MELFADISCPFTHVGLRMFVQRRTQLGVTEPRLWIRAWPLELVNGELLDASLIAHKIEALREQVAPDMFKGFNESTLQRSYLPAMELAASGYAVDDVTGEAVSLGLRDALFEEGLDLGDPSVLAEIGARHGLAPVSESDSPTVHADWVEGKARNVQGSPHYFLNDADFFCPSLSITKVDGELEIKVDKAGFEAFLDDAFAEA